MGCDDSLKAHDLNWVERSDTDVLLCLKCVKKNTPKNKNVINTTDDATAATPGTSTTTTRKPEQNETQAEAKDN
jgi:hypothetical protein